MPNDQTTFPVNLNSPRREASLVSPFQSASKASPRSQARRTRRRRRMAYVLALVLLISSLAACSRYKEIGKQASNYPDKVKDDSTAEQHLFEGVALQEAADKFREKLGGNVRALSLIVNSDYAVLQAQDPRNPEHIDSYEYRHGVVSEPTPVKLLGAGKLEDNLFSFDDVSFAAAPDLTRAALERIKIEDAEPSHMIIQRSPARGQRVQWLVYVKGTRKDGYLTADGKGNVLDATTF